jgi:hypothetical protein
LSILSDSNRAQEEFILSIRGLDNSWAATQLQDLIKKEQKDEDFPPIADLIAESTLYYERTHPIASGLGTFATLGVAGGSQDQEAQEVQAGKPQPAQNSLQARTQSRPQTLTCLDEENHKFDNCLYVNQSVRTRGWKPDQAIQGKFTDLQDSSTTNSMANALRAVERDLKKKLKAEMQSTSKISMDNGQPAHDRPHVNAVLQTAAATGLLAPPLLTRWILDPGLNCHLTNTRGADWTSTQTGGPLDVMYAGVLAQVEE